ncbi:magnesium chelatase subunit H [Paludicola sp. MB14-C6]|uniref:magnesium chelatase subunit H n=1 Tax=Paludihabitans sp. MB14-C6 TaxID=3070656 RepID=UPI0027DB5605|nr:magnesium chelatase subunit H [Paludicola sp. MB14-C6]WMJ23139.1 magnesium chelatase subunit H [Paludicola sp. MB14-C6]
MKIVFITVSSPAIKSLIESNKLISEKYPNALELSLFYATSEFSEKKLNKMIDCIINADLVFVDLMGSPSLIVKAVYKGLESCKGNVISYGNSAREFLRLGKFSASEMKSDSMKEPSMESIKKMQSMAEKMGKIMPGKMRDMRNYSLIIKYFKIANRHNIYNMLLLILNEYGDYDNLENPQMPYEADSISVCDPNHMKFYSSVSSYANEFGFNELLPNIAIIFSANTYPNDTSKCVYKIQTRLSEFANVIPIAVSGSFCENEDKFKEFLLNSTAKPIDLIINVMPFRLGAGPMGGDFNAGINLLKEVNAPYLHPFFLTRKTQQDWLESVQGCGPSEVLISVMLPELDGAIQTFPIASKSENECNEAYDVATDELAIIEERVEKLASCVKKQINLRTKPNSEKRVAIICYNYPPGEGNLFGGAFLDTFASIESILKNLNQEGYSVNTLSKDELMNIFTAGKAVNSGKYDCNWDDMIEYPVKKYSAESKVTAEWGKAPGNVMANENNFLIPGTIQKNVFVGLQPSRGIHENVEKAYHDKTLPPHHQYIAFYQWLKNEFKADAIIHVGTHGTLEFLMGKECGMSGNCYPDKLIADIPHTYLYYCGNPSEAVIAKRRSHANIVSYQPPVFVESELYDDYLSLSTEIDHYRQALILSPQSANEILANIYKKAKQINLPEELEVLENELYRMSTSLIPKGLHVFGNGYSQEEGKAYARGLIRYNRNGYRALCDLIAQSEKLDINNLESSKNCNALAKELFNYYMNNDKLPEVSYIDKKNKEDFLNTLNYAKKISIDACQNNEIQGMLKTLCGEYNPAKLAGDIYRAPEVLPCGGNVYQFDPRLVPSITAFERGKRVCDNTLEAYFKEEKSYPQSTAVILWGLETSRTQGETFAQILSYLGVKISNKSNVWEMKFDIIPINELNRPRIDVTINICGFFRDMFPNLIEGLDDLFVKLYELDETDEENYFKAHSKKIYKKLLEEGYEEQDAKELAISRIFGPKEGEYGTGITGIIETKNWETESQIGESFIASLKHVYNRRMHGRSVHGLYERNLKCVDIVSQLRSNHEYEITDLDHYYEFFGGLSKSVELAKGTKAKMFITDTTEEKIHTETVDKSIARGIRTRVLNPKWIDGMLSHSYHGAQKIAERFENVLGLSATTNSVDEWIYDDLHKSYVEDEELRNRMIENNPHAYMNILEQMMEYNSRGYWNATQEQLDKIKQVYLEIEDKIEETV